MFLGDNFLSLCNRMSDVVFDSIKDIIGTYDANTTMYMGADGTPTKLIDDVSEKAIFSLLEKEGISLRILSEEYGERLIGKSPEYTLIIDPLDGTYNASAGIPFYSVSIAFVREDINNAFFGYVRNLATGDTFYAQKGKGAFFNGKRLKTSGKTNINKYCISVYGYRPHVEETTTLCKKVRRIRILGSVALELCYVAAGKLDAFVDVRGSLRLTDIAAGKLIIEEAGGIVTDGNGASLELEDSIVNKVYMVASNGCSHTGLLKLLKRGEQMRVSKIGIVSRYDNEDALTMVRDILDTFKDKVDIVISPKTANFICAPERAMKVEDMRSAGVELVISVGGDGTVLRNISKMDDPLPILGINMGTLGFLVDVAPENAIEAIEDVLKGFNYDERARLSVEFNNKVLPPATNEVVLITARPAKILTFKISVDNSQIEELRADGVVFATPTGSTAYAMSAGGPIIDPRVEASLIVPLAPFKLSARPWVIPASSNVTVEMIIPEKEAVIVIDGQHSYNIKEHDIVTLKGAKNPARFVSSSINGFYEKVQSKLA